MKIKQEIEWVVGENPGEPSVKLVVVEHEGRVEVTTGSFSRCDSTSEPRWYYTNNAEIPYWTSSVLAWASMPHYHGFPAEGQKVEFTNAHKCEQEHPDPVVERLIKAVKILGRECQRQLGKEYGDASPYELPGINAKLYQLGRMDEYVRTGKEQL